MQQKIVISNGKRFIVNCADYDEGVGAGFSVGQLVMKSYGDANWYVIMASGSSGNVGVYVSQSALPYATGPVWWQGTYSASIIGSASYYEQNYPYQLLASSDGNTYQIYLTGSAPNASVVVSQSMYRSGSYVTGYDNTIYWTAKPYLLLQSITDLNYYMVSLTGSSGQVTMSVSQTVISQSWIQSIY